MRLVLLGLAAPLAAITAVVPAQAQTFTSSSSGAFPRAVQLPPPGSPMMGRHHGGRHHRGNDVIVDGWGGYYDPQNNRSWDSYSFNDWWHDRPDRAYPRWVRHNDNCERVFWVGEGWRCTM
jgi:hypothetical protein